jgi:hypothetical protein
MVPLGTNSAAALPASSSDAALELDHGGVVAEDVVADLGFGHGAAHGGGGPGDRVAAEVDGRERHGTGSIADRMVYPHGGRALTGLAAA